MRPLPLIATALALLLAGCDADRSPTRDVRSDDATSETGRADVDPDATDLGPDDAVEPDSSDHDVGDATERETTPDGGASDATDAARTDADTRDTPDADDADGADASDPRVPGWAPPYGASQLSGGRVAFRLRAPNATRVEAWVYDAPIDGEVATITELSSDGDGTWRGIADAGGAIYYGYRLWGPNWAWDPAWEPGSELGFGADVDAAGNRFNPNKLVVDPYAFEVSHDPGNPQVTDWAMYRSGPFERALDSGPRGPKGIVLPAAVPAARPPAPTRPLRDEVIYEVHLRGLTMQHPDVPEELRGTYAGAALLAPYLAELGVSAVEFLPLHETQNEQNDLEVGTAGDNYWGYASLSFMAPDRRYAHDRSPGGPTRELQAMVDAFHTHDIKVYVDVVYNHTGEGGSWGDDGEYANILSWRGVDNATWYQVIDGARYRNDNGVGPNLDFTAPIVGDAVLDSLRYWHETIGVDGFRFDLAAVLGNTCTGDCFEYAQTALPDRIAHAMARGPDGGAGVDLIAEPWGVTAGTYQAGRFPHGWSEWNDRFRDTIRSAQNELPPPTPAELAMRLHGSSDIYRDDGRGPSAGISYVVSHDGFTLADLYRCDAPDNDQEWPFGPSDGGDAHNRSWDQGGDPGAQRQAARTGLALAVLSGGVPMLTGGDELLRTQRCNNNPYNLDSPANWLDWELDDEQELFRLFTSRLLALRHRYSALRPAWWTEGVDRDDDGLADIGWYDQSGALPDGFWDDRYAPVIAWRLDADEAASEGARSIFVAWNRSDDAVPLTLPLKADDTAWYRVIDTAWWFEPDGNSHAPGDEYRMGGDRYDVFPRSLIVMIER